MLILLLQWATEGNSHIQENAKHLVLSILDNVNNIWSKYNEPTQTFGINLPRSSSQFHVYFKFNIITDMSLMTNRYSVFSEKSIQLFQSGRVQTAFHCAQCFFTNPTSKDLGL